MSRVRSKSQPRPANRLLHATVFLSAMLSISLQDNIARAADLWPDSFRVGKSIQKFEETWQYAVAWQLRAPRRIRAQYLDLAVGVIESPGDSRTFISLGPVWRLPIVADRFSVNAGISPTLLSGSNFDGRDMGGSFHFTSSAELELAVGDSRDLLIALRFQHTSNGGLSGTNPGMDIVGMSFRYNFGR